MNFKETVLSMKASEIIMAMVESLIPPPLIRIDMNTYGDVRPINGEQICFGCAATNTVCKIANKMYTPSTIYSTAKRSNFIFGNSVFDNYNFLYDFEQAINGLRIGDIYIYNIFASRGKFPQINVVPDISLPMLNSNYTKKDLKPYIRLAKRQAEYELLTTKS